MEGHGARASWDRPLGDILRLDWEKAAYLAILLLAIGSRFWDLGARSMSFDETTHSLYSYKLYAGEGFVHNPLMHGPFLFHANALIFFLFGDNDYTARIVPALFGVFLVMSPLLLRPWLTRAGAMIASALLLVSPSFLYYSRYIRNDVYMNVWMVLLIAALFHLLAGRKPRWFYAGAAALMLSLATKENAYLFGFTAVAFVAAAVVWQRVDPRRRVWLYLGGAAVTALFLVPAYLLGRPPAEGEEAAAAAGGAVTVLDALLTVVGGTIPALLVAGTLIRSRHPLPSRVEQAVRSLSWRHWLIAAAIMLLIYVLLFTTFFTNPAGLVTGIPGSLSYWLAQQDVQRGTQPLYYYLMLLALYEFVPLLFGTAGAVYYLLRPPTPASREARATADPNVLLPDHSPAAPARAGVRSEHARWSDSDSLFVSFLIFWALNSLFLYSWAGERMPWMVVHQALPILLLAGRFLGDLGERVDWRGAWQGGGALLALLLPATLFSLWGVTRLREANNVATALPLAFFLLLLAGYLVYRLGARHTLAVTGATSLAFLSFFSARAASMASFVNYDHATEPLVYAHGTPDVKQVMGEIAEISERTVGDRTIAVAYDVESSWPIEWYMRHYPNRNYYADSPTREALDVPLVIASTDVDDRVQPFLGDRYLRLRRRGLWWPTEEYKDLTWPRIRDILASPEKRRVLWDIFYWRRYPRTTDDWYHASYFYFYVRKDVAQQLWQFGARSPAAIEPPPDRYVEAHVDLDVVQVWGDTGTGPGQFNHPRGVAVGPDGSVYVTDSDNARVQVFDGEGRLLRAWGSRCALDTGLGCTTPRGEGQFQEPWGVAVGSDGRVYVADTWNHRIEVFDADGRFLAQWGTFGQTSDAANLLYGPRGVAVDTSGRIFVTDTGNKRVVVYDPQGGLLAQWGGAGSGPGQFEEPVGIALDASGNVYVADTWNGRIQLFDRELRFVREWPVDGWYGQSVVNKPYLAVDGQGRVYATDPEGYRVAVFGAEGELLATFGRYGFEPDAFSLPTGIAVDQDGFILVADTGGQRLVKLAPLP